MCTTNACEDPTSAGVWWRDDAEWKQYNAVHAAAILQGVRDRANRVELGNLASLKYAGGARYLVDLTRMKQINLASGYTRDVKVVSPRAIAATAASNDGDGVKEELRAAQEVYQIISKLLFYNIQCLAELDAKFFPVQSQVVNNDARGLSANMADGHQRSG